MVLETLSPAAGVAGDDADQTIAPRLTSLNGAPFTAGHSEAREEGDTLVSLAAPSTPRGGKVTKCPRSTPRRKQGRRRSDVTALVVDRNPLDFSNLITPRFPDSASAPTDTAMAASIDTPTPESQE